MASRGPPPWGVVPPCYVPRRPTPNPEAPYRNEACNRGAPDDPRQVGHLGKVGLLAADLLVFDRNRLAWRLATRTMLTLILPLLASYTLDQPLLIYVGIAGWRSATASMTAIDCSSSDLAWARFSARWRSPAAR